jgi:hypothetical protein
MASRSTRDRVHDAGQFGDEYTFFAGSKMTVLPLKAISTARVCAHLYALFFVAVVAMANHPLEWRRSVHLAMQENGHSLLRLGR